MKIYLIAFLLQYLTLIEAFSLYDLLPCSLRECCNDQYIVPNFMALETSLRKNVFGQHIIIDALTAALKYHFTTEPKKPLLLIMHGWTGCGKNYVTQIMVENIYKEKGSSRFVHYFNARIHFPLESQVDEYIINLQKWVKGNVSECERSIFIFDEVDKIPPGVLDSIKPYFDFHQQIDGVNFRKSIFLFLSNVGGDLITLKYLQLWQSGVSREQMKLSDFEPILRTASYKDNNAFQKSSALRSYLISFHLPFLPLEKNHVKSCIYEEMNRQNFFGNRIQMTEDILNELEFYKQFSSSGCKRIHSLVAINKYNTLLQKTEL